MATVEFDADGQVLGRLASRIAVALMGKNSPTFRRDRLPDIEVIVHHADRISVTGRKTTGKQYYRFSGYPGGLKKTSFQRLQATHPERLLYSAVKRMLPKNTLQAKLMKRLKLEIGSI